MTRLTRTSLLLLWPAFALFASCGGGDDTKAPPVGSSIDGGDVGDATGTGEGAGTNGDGGPAGDGSYGDGSEPSDGEAGSEQPDGGGGPQQIEIPPQNEFEFDVSDNDQIWDHHGYALAAAGTEFALAFQNSEPGTDCTRIDVVLIPSFGEMADPLTVVNKDMTPCSRAKQPAIISHQDVWRLVWTDNRGGAARLYHLTVDSDDEPAAVTDSDLVEEKPALAYVNERPMLAWISEDPDAGRSISARVLDSAEGNAKTVAERGDGHQPEELALAPAAVTLGAVAWMDLSEAQGGYFLRLLDENGASRNDAERFSDYAYAAGSLDITGDSRAGAMVYSIAIDGIEQVRFRTFNLSGITPDERKLVTPVARAKDASIAWFGGHEYLIAYRALSGPDLDSPMIRLVVVDTGQDWDPASLQPFDVAPAAADGGRTTVRIAHDGTAVIAWLDAISSEQKILRAVRLH